MELNAHEKKYIRDKVGKLTVPFIVEHLGIEVKELREFCKKNKLSTRLIYKAEQIDLNEKFYLSGTETKFIYDNLTKMTQEEMSDIIGITEQTLKEYLEEYRHIKNIKIHGIINELMPGKFDNETEIIDYMEEQLKTKTLQSIGYEIGLDKSAIGLYFYENGIRVVQKKPKSKNRMTEEEEKKCVEYLKENYGLKHMMIMSVELDRGSNTLNRLINRYGIQRNK